MSARPLTPAGKAAAADPQGAPGRPRPGAARRRRVVPRGASRLPIARVPASFLSPTPAPASTCSSPAPDLGLAPSLGCAPREPHRRPAELPGLPRKDRGAGQKAAGRARGAPEKWLACRRGAEPRGSPPRRRRPRAPTCGRNPEECRPRAPAAPLPLPSPLRAPPLPADVRPRRALTLPSARAPPHAPAPAPRGDGSLTLRMVSGPSGPDSAT